jgi:cell wall-associated NlpC family hydrolase
METETPETPPSRRKLVVTLLAVVVAAGALIVAVQFAPSETKAAPPVPAAAEVEAPPPTEVPVVLQDSVKVPEKPGQEFDAWASKTSQWLDIPLRAMQGYAKTTIELGKEQPGCHLSWITLAAVGKTTTDHGRVGGDQLAESGVPVKPLGTIEVKDFYNRVVSTAHASGPLQLTPSIWTQFQKSASGGTPDPQNIDDAALTAGRALCAGGRDLSKGDDWWAAVTALQPAPLFLHRTLATANVYGTVGLSPDAPNPQVLDAINFAIGKIGLPYVWGGNGTGGSDPGFDCSGLTTAAYASAGITLKRTADTQFHSVKAVPAGSEPALGDLIFYGDPKTKIHHVGLYIGNQQMIDAPNTGQAVQVHTYRKPNDDFAGAGRPTA